MVDILGKEINEKVHESRSAIKSFSTNRAISGKVRSSFIKKSIKVVDNKYLNKFQLLFFFLIRNLKIEFLDMTNTIIDIDSMNRILMRCNHLQKLSLESLLVNEQTFQWISYNKEIDTLNLGLCQGINKDCLEILLNSLKS
jgi:hypothetical protein